MFNTKGNTLHIDGVSTADLANEYGTPLYVYSENKILDQLNQIRVHFLDKYPNTHAAYACKAFCTLYMCRLLEREGFWLDVVSGGELYTAMQAGFPAERIEFNGNNKSTDELKMALSYGVERIVIDNVQELYDVESLYARIGRTVKVLFRITPEVNTDTHAYISTAKKDSKFGIPLDESILFPIIEYAIKSETIDFLGFHFHVGSQLMNANAHLSALEVILRLMLETKMRFAYDVKDFNMGGGFGIKYTDEDLPLVLSEFVDPIMERLESFCLSNSLTRPHVSMEPGRFIVGDAGIQLYTIGTIKKIPDTKTYVSIDGGMTDNLRPGLYGAKYHALIANKMEETRTNMYAISGKCCESTDILIHSIALPKPETGDLLCVFSTGSYGYSMANNYNKIPIPAVVVIKNGKPEEIVRRQTYMDLIQREI